MWKEFKTFIARGNVLDLAVAVVIGAAFTAIVTSLADDLINPPELGILEREITRVAKGRAIVLPLTPETRGHGSHTIAALWKRQLQDLLAATEP